MDNGSARPSSPSPRGAKCRATAASVTPSWPAGDQRGERSLSTTMARIPSTKSGTSRNRHDTRRSWSRHASNVPSPGRGSVPPWRPPARSATCPRSRRPPSWRRPPSGGPDERRSPPQKQPRSTRRSTNARPAAGPAAWTREARDDRGRIRARPPAAGPAGRRARGRHDVIGQAERQCVSGADAPR